jgi:hypothetical protein
MQDNASEPPAVSFYASAISTENHISEHGSIGAPRQGTVSADDGTPAFCTAGRLALGPQEYDARW